MPLSLPRTTRVPLFCAVGGLALVVALPAAAQDLSQPGPFLAGWRDVTVTRPNGSTFTAAVYYPALTSGANALFDPSDGPYPAVSFGHGFLQSVEQYQSTLAHLATWGFVVIASRSEGGLFPSHANFAADLRHCLTYLETAHSNPGAWLFGQVRTDRFGFSGHSMGGGASILAAAADPRVRAVANLAAAETNPSAVSAMSNVSVPISLIAGDDDTIVPVSSNGQLMYNAGRAPKQLPVIRGGFHCGFVDANFLFCDSGALSRPAQLAITRRLLTAFFRLYLADDQTLWRAVWGPEFFNDPALDTTRTAAGVALSPGTTTLAGPAGFDLTGALTVMNTAPTARSYTLFAEGGPWPVTFDPPQTPTLAPGESAAIAVRMALPVGGSGDSVALLLSARSDLDGGTRGFATWIVTRTPGRGDLNCDGQLDFNDIDPFVTALGGEAGYSAAYPGCRWHNADCNRDGVVDFDDIDPFVALLAE